MKVKLILDQASITNAYIVVTSHLCMYSIVIANHNIVIMLASVDSVIDSKTDCKVVKSFINSVWQRGFNVVLE